MKHALSNNTRTKITNIISETDIQPNAVDLRVEKILITSPQTFILSEDKRIHRGSKELPTRNFQNEDGWWGLNPGYYEVVFQNEIKVGKNEAGFVISRSSLIRNGVYLLSGLYDSGYEGNMVAGLHVTTGTFYVKKGTRLGQYLLFDAEMVRMYNGAYGFVKLNNNEEYSKRLKKRKEDSEFEQKIKEKKHGGLIKFKKKEEYPPILKPTENDDNDDIIENKPKNNLLENVQESIKNELDEIKGII